MKRISSAVIIVLAFPLIVFAVRKPSDSAPDTARDYYMILNDGTADEIEVFYSKEYQDEFAKLPHELQKILSFENISKRVTRGHTVTSIDIQKVTYPPYGASVTVRLHFKDGGTENYNADLTKEDKVWKLLYH